MAHPDSNKVSVFPSVYRTFNPSGKFTNETNFANIVKSIVDKNSYVVSYSDEILRLVIFGYYFVIEDVTSLPLWAAIHVEEDTLARCFNLVNFVDNSTTLDDTATNTFRGLYFGTTGTPPSGEVSPGSGVFAHSLMIRENGRLNTTRLSSDSVYYTDPGGSDYGVTITDKINSKEDRIEAGTGIKKYIDNNIKYFGIADAEYARIEGLKNLVGTDNRAAKLSYFDDSGILRTSTVDRGVGFDGQVSQSVYVREGYITPGIRIFYNTTEPNVSGQEGDIWIRYTNN